MKKKRYVVGVTGASGVIYAQRLLEVLCTQASVDLVISDIAREIAGYEGVSLEGFDAVYHGNGEMGADIASGSCQHDGMVIIPCTVKDLAAIAHGLSDTLITRAADVSLKERRGCILVLREMPLSRVHLRNMLAADEAGATVMVASPGFYHRPETVLDLVDMVVARVLDHLGEPHSLATRWKGF
ncbi:MAG: UbiX family flavin prenyltransferase [Methanoregulaceae archaeon]|nr:UbiX family flavin prenyltransferase [Methanoregulaceae archaeon]